MLEFLKSIIHLVKLRNRIFKNTFLRSDNWFKFIAIGLFVFLLLNSIQSGAFTFQYVIDNFNKELDLFSPLFNLILSLLFLVNILSALFLGGSNAFQNLLHTLSFYPIKFKRIILYEILSGAADFINLLFLPFYITAIFVSNGILGVSSFLIHVIILVLFLFLISNIVYLIKNIISLIRTVRYSGKILLLISLLFAVAFMFILKRLPFFLEDTNNIILVSKILELFPAGFYSYFILNINSDMFKLFLLTFTYFLTMNILVIIPNYYLAKYLRNKSYTMNYSKNSLKKSFLTKFFITTSINPFSKKDILYSLRSFRTLSFHLMFIIGIIIILLIAAMDKGQSFNNISDQYSVSVLFNSLIVLSFSGNIFAFDGAGIVNYFFRPISYSGIIKTKTFIPNFYFAIILLATLILCLIGGIEINNIIFLGLILFLNYLLLLIFATPLSFYFPKKVNFNAMNSFLTSLISLFIFLVFAFILWFIFLNVINYYLYSNSKILIFLSVCLAIIPFYYFKGKILTGISRLLAAQKEKIILVFR